LLGFDLNLGVDSEAEVSNLPILTTFKNVCRFDISMNNSYLE